MRISDIPDQSFIDLRCLSPIISFVSTPRLRVWNGLMMMSASGFRRSTQHRLHEVGRKMFGRWLPEHFTPFIVDIGSGWNAGNSAAFSHHTAPVGLVSIRYTVTPSRADFDDMTTCPSFRRPDSAARTVCFCQPRDLQMVGVRAPFRVFNSVINLAFLVWAGFTEAGYCALLLSGFPFDDIWLVVFVMLFSTQLAWTIPEPCTE